MHESLEIGILNCMLDAAIRATERQFGGLLLDAAGPDVPLRIRWFFLQPRDRYESVNDLRRDGLDAMTAAYEAGRTRLRPVVMTAAAMLAGMVPMAMGLGEGGEQNAPLGRAVIGGLMMATVATLFIVPVVYSLMRKTPPKRFEELELTEE